MTRYANLLLFILSNVYDWITDGSRLLVD